MRRKILGVLAVLALGIGGTAVAWAATSDSNTISACVAKNGKVSIYPPGQACLASEHSITWNVQGPAGPPGPPGAPGPADPNTLTAGGMITIVGQGFDTPSLVIAVSHEIVSPRDPQSGLPTGKRQHKPLTIRKEIDKSTPLLMRAIFTNQNLPTVTVNLNGPDGKVEATVKLTNASVADHVQQGSTETVSFTYQKITWTWVDGGITAEDDWNPPTG
jgi:type VI secretion system secreted protein Hcp